MKAVTSTVAGSRPAANFVWGTGLALLIVLWSFGFALGCSSASAGEPQTDGTGPADIVEFDPSDDESEVESVTMSIDLEEGGVIDLDAPVTDVKIERWQGDQVLVIVEKTRRPSSQGERRTSAEPVNIQVTRHGKDVRIQTTGGSDWDQSGMDLSFRIVLPGRFQAEPSGFQRGETLTRLTSTLWRVFQKDALKWLVR